MSIKSFYLSTSLPSSVYIFNSKMKKQNTPSPNLENEKDDHQLFCLKWPYACIQVSPDGDCDLI
jgi:hypothetical protein